MHQTNESATGVAMVAVDKKGQNQIIVVPGANNYVTREVVEGATALIASKEYLILQNEIALAGTVAAVEVARENGVKVIFNIAPADNSPKIINLITPTKKLILRP